jgi:hypothetical protein
MTVGNLGYWCSLFFNLYWRPLGHAVALLVEALCYKPEGPGSITDEVIGFLN